LGSVGGVAAEITESKICTTKKKTTMFKVRYLIQTTFIPCHPTTTHACGDIVARAEGTVEHKLGEEEVGRLIVPNFGCQGVPI
jgi:hypothetical protein